MAATTAMILALEKDFPAGLGDSGSTALSSGAPQLLQNALVSWFSCWQPAHFFIEAPP